MEGGRFTVGEHLSGMLFTVLHLSAETAQSGVPARLRFSGWFQEAGETAGITVNNDEERGPPWGYTLGFSPPWIFLTFMVYSQISPFWDPF